MMIVNPEAPGRDVIEMCDVAVIGTGAGGAVFAAELAAAGLSVILVESGPWIDPATYDADPYSANLRLYQDAGQTATVGTPGIPLPFGRTVGGTTVINSGTCFRTPPEKLRAWRRDLGVVADDLDEAGLAPLFDAVEARLGVAPVPEETVGHNARIFRRGCEALGLEAKPLRRNARGCRGTGVCVTGCPRNAKQSMLLTYLPDAVSHGARIYQRAHAEVVLVDHGRTTGLRARLLDERGRSTRHTLTIHARVVGVAAGALGTPLLLARSGIGGASGRLGRNLSIHPGSKAFAELDETVDPLGVPQGLWVDLRGAAAGKLGGRDAVFEGIAVPPEIGALALPGVGAAHSQLMSRYRHMASFGIMVPDSATGRVRALAGGPLMLYDLAPVDATTFRDGLALMAEVFFAAGARRVLPGIHGFPELRSAADVARLRAARVRPSDLDLMAFHPMGTAVMGPSPAHSGVDPGARDPRRQGLLRPSLGVNPQESIFAFALRAARFVVGRADRYV